MLNAVLAELLQTLGILYDYGTCCKPQREPYRVVLQFRSQGLGLNIIRDDTRT